MGVSQAVELAAHWSATIQIGGSNNGLVVQHRSRHGLMNNLDGQPGGWAGKTVHLSETIERLNSRIRSG